MKVLYYKKILREEEKKRIKISLANILYYFYFTIYLDIFSGFFYISFSLWNINFIRKIVKVITRLIYYCILLSYKF
jgi:hypothetical protein